MASAQVLPNSIATSARKKDLEAGKRRLEEFRKKKKEGRGKKSGPSDQLPTVSVDLAEKVSDEPVTAELVLDKNSVLVDEASALSIDCQSSGTTGSLENVDIDQSNGVHSVLMDNEQQLQSSNYEKESNSYRGLGFPGLANGYDDNWRNKRSEVIAAVSDLVATNLQKALDPLQTTEVNDNQMRQSNVLATVDTNSDGYLTTERHSKIYDSSLPSHSNGTTGSLGNGIRQHGAGFSSKSHALKNSDVKNGSMDVQEHASFSTRGRINDSINRHLNIDTSDRHVSENSSSEYNSTSKGSYGQNQYTTSTWVLGSSSGRTRPSFLDSINIPRVSLVSDLQSKELIKLDLPVLPNVNYMIGDIHPKSPLQSPTIEPDPLESAGHDKTDEKMESSPEKDDNFASLEQHIEDLTREKFSLKRALETSQSLAQSLASENTSLTESFNQQGKVINQLKSDMEQLQEEIRTQLLAFEALKAEYANAQLECNAADERAKILASEVISLEEKALRLRSNELKLEKQLENSDIEISSCRRKLSSLEKERHDFQSTIEALLEEKKFLQSKLWKASLNEHATESKVVHAKKDASTCTEDLDIDRGIDIQEAESLRHLSEEARPLSSAISSEYAASSYLQREITNFLPDANTTIPNDQMKMINNINSLISEIALEKEELLQALSAESSMTSKLKDLNKELSHKLEVQTQRFELLAAQQMASENVHPRPLEDTRNAHDATDYTDEGDEVVERVLGWIMKLFPGGPAKRRTSKLL